MSKAGRNWTGAGVSGSGRGDGPNSAAPGGWLWLPQGTVATGVGAPGSQIQFAAVAGSGRDDYLQVKPDGSVAAWFNGGAS